MDGQYSIFDCFADLGAPSSYKFERYIGQRVVWHDIHGTITEIEPYYTMVHLDNFRIIAATPHDLAPEEEDKWFDRRGRLVPAPDWANEERCQKCAFWELDIVDDQPPDGWGVYGTCHYLREGQRGYNHTGQNSYCGEYRERTSGKESE